MARQRTVVVTGSASGMGAATRARLQADGQRVIGVDLRDADVVADLGLPEGRQAAVDAVAGLCGGSLDGLVTWAGLAGLTDRPGSLLVSVNYFGAMTLLEGLRPLLAVADRPAAIAISSNSTMIQPGIPMDVVEKCLAGDENGARKAADAAGSLATYPATKTAIAWWVRRNAARPRLGGCGHHAQRRRARRGGDPAAAGQPRGPDHRAVRRRAPHTDRSHRARPTSWPRSSCSCSVQTLASSAAQSSSSTAVPTLVAR